MRYFKILEWLCDGTHMDDIVQNISSSVNLLILLMFTPDIALGVARFTYTLKTMHTLTTFTEHIHTSIMGKIT